MPIASTSRAEEFESSSHRRAMVAMRHGHLLYSRGVFITAAR